MSVQPIQLYYKEQLEKGIEFQDFVNSLLYDIGIVVVQYQSKRYQFERGENSGGIEIKFDDKFERTGNLYIECAEKSHPDNDQYMPSGIYRYDNSWLYAIGNYQVVYLFVTRHLRWLHERKPLIEKQTQPHKDFSCLRSWLRNTLHGFYAARREAKVWRPNPRSNIAARTTSLKDDPPFVQENLIECKPAVIKTGGVFPRTIRVQFVGSRLKRNHGPRLGIAALTNQII